MYVMHVEVNILVCLEYICILLIWNYVISYMDTDYREERIRDLLPPLSPSFAPFLSPPLLNCSLPSPPPFDVSPSIPISCCFPYFPPPYSAFVPPSLLWCCPFPPFSISLSLQTLSY